MGNLNKELELGARVHTENILTPTQSNRDSRDEPQQEISIPPADGGRQAWLFLAAAFVTEGLVWGLPLSFGVFQEYYANHPPFSSAPSGLAVVGTLQSGLVYLCSPPIFTLIIRYPWLQRPCLFVGAAIIIIAVLSASFASVVWHLIITQGILHGIGSALILYPTLSYIQDWFDRHRGFAMGVMWGGSGLFGAVAPICMSFALQRFGFRTVLRGWAIIFTVLCTPILYFVRGRTPCPPKSQQSTRPLHLSFLRRRAFWAFQIPNIIEGLGYFLPMVYLPLVANALGQSTTAGTGLAVANNLATVFGGVAAGHLSDVFDVTLVVAIGSVAAGAACFFAWGFASNLPVLIVFAVLFGLFSGAYSPTWPGISRKLQNISPEVDSVLLLGCFSFGRGIGSVVSGPLSEVMIRAGGFDGAGWEYGGRYGALIVFTGMMMVGGALGGIAKPLKWIE